MLCGHDVENWSDESDGSDGSDGSDESDLSDLSDWSDWSDLTKPNATDATVSTGTLETLERVFRHGVLVEENTGRLCMNCPRGMVGMKELRDAYPEQMVGIAITVITKMYTKTQCILLNTTLNLKRWKVVHLFLIILSAYRSLWCSRSGLCFAVQRF